MDLHARNTDFVFTAKVRSQSSSVLFVNGMPGVDPAPALFTRMSILPHASRVRSTIALTSAELVTSVFIATTLRPSALTSVATFSACSTWMSAIAMSAPSRAIASTIPRPMPLPPPVTTATLPASRMRISFLYNRCLGGFPRGSRDLLPGGVLDDPRGDVVRKSRGEGRGGVPGPFPARGGGAPRGVKKAPPRHAHGRRLRRCPRHHGHGRPHAPRQVAHGGARLGHRRLAALGRAARGPNVGRGALRGGVLHVALVRPLHGHGDGVHDGLDG